MSQTKAQLIDGKSAKIEFTGGTASAPAISFTGDTNTGIYSPGADQLALSTNGTGRLFVDASGNVGIGPTPNNYANYSTLTLNGTTGGIIDFEANGTIYGELQALANEFRVNAVGASSALKLYAGGAERLRIDSSGRLLVGTSSSVGSRELQLASGFSANTNRSSSFAKSLALSDNVSTTYFTIAIPAFVDFADVLSVGVEVSYVVTAHRQTSSRGATATYGKVYLAISRYWESSAVAPIVTALTTTDQALAFADQGANPTITWAVSQDAGTDQAAKNVYLSITVDNTASGTIVQRVDGTAAMNCYTTRGVIGIS